MQFTFRPVSSIHDLNSLIDFLWKQQERVFYPNYDSWLEGVCKPELESGYKRAWIALYDHLIIGNVVVQRHKQLPALELKNARVDERAKGRNVASFLFRQVEVENPFGFMIADFPADDIAIEGYLLSQGWQISYQAQLYDSERLEKIVVKPNRILFPHQDIFLDPALPVSKYLKQAQRLANLQAVQDFQ
ncbi:hypothetical protein C4573_01950 [Candidatus Woesearchaeota archaeon]|nr:MAG: hypothetical protein C4573_01950 [Candidatus Woesearchaeota archaeon]